MLFQFLHCGPECNRINSHLRSRMQYKHTCIKSCLHACTYRTFIYTYITFIFVNFCIHMQGQFLQLSILLHNTWKNQFLAVPNFSSESLTLEGISKRHRRLVWWQPLSYKICKVNLPALDTEVWRDLTAASSKHGIFEEVLFIFLT